jgi:tetratricopeptide (TPR) repeat protein
MVRVRQKIRLTMAVLCAVFLVAGAATAQVSDSEEKALRKVQAAQFAEMFEKPDDLDLMFKYALTSIRLLDFEAAISTLERILIFNPDLPQVRTELGASYFRVGSYPVARHYFTEVQADQNASAKLQARAARFLVEIENRTKKSSFVGVVSANALFSTNANNGPGSAAIIINGAAFDAIQGDDQAQTDFGGSVSAIVSHRYDLDGPDEDFWRTDLAILTTRFAETDAGSIDVAVLRTGPRLSINDDRYGSKLRPYVELSHARSQNKPLQTVTMLGAEITNTIDKQTSLFSNFSFGYRDNHRSGTDQDGPLLKTSLGFNQFVNKDVTLRARGFFEVEAAHLDSDKSFLVGANGTATYRYDSGMEFASRPWRLAATGRISYRNFNAKDPVADVRREDVDMRVGLKHTAFLPNDFAMTAKAEYKIRDSTITQFDLDALNLSVGLQYAF